ncbi:MAG: META domain-containing protein [Candidatus Pacebacteria bacterium]|jgi:heat shock protein HslJ/membrane-bound inhibitor of C-type lysozyme|nr:META domain-containing protein [Candidatus Paceibacterota bacterium]
MRATYLIVTLMLLLLLGGAFWIINHRNNTLSIDVVAGEQERFADATKIVYQSENGEITVEYISNLARVTGGVYDGVVFRQVVSASGAKYEGKQGITLWTKNNEVRIETPQQVIYTGTAVTPSVPKPATPTVIEESLPAIPSATTTDDEVVSLEGKTWVWQSALRGGETIKPKKVETFSLTFTTDGTVQGATDCNGFVGNYKSSGNQTTLGPLRSTLMFCEGSEESLFTKLLEGPLTIIELTNDLLILKNAAGDNLTFSKKV